MTPERVARLRAVLDKRQPDLTVVTDQVHKGRNLSAIVRNCDAAGIMQMHSVMPENSYKAFRGTAMGSHRWVRVMRSPTLKEALTPLKDSGYQIVAADIGHHSVNFHDIDYTKPTAILLGAEKKGLSAEAVELTDSFVTIPMVGMVESFNVSVAAGVILSEAIKQREEAGLYQNCRIDQATYNRIFFQWAHPKIRKFCDSNGLKYPALSEDGEIDNPSLWYSRIKENTIM